MATAEEYRVWAEHRKIQSGLYLVRKRRPTGDVLKFGLSTNNLATRAIMSRRDDRHMKVIGVLIVWHDNLQEKLKKFVFELEAVFISTIAVNEPGARRILDQEEVPAEYEIPNADKTKEDAIFGYMCALAHSDIAIRIAEDLQTKVRVECVSALDMKRDIGREHIEVRPFRQRTVKRRVRTRAALLAVADATAEAARRDAAGTAAAGTAAAGTAAAGTAAGADDVLLSQPFYRSNPKELKNKEGKLIKGPVSVEAYNDLPAILKRVKPEYVSPHVKFAFVQDPSRPHIQNIRVDFPAIIPQGQIEFDGPGRGKSHLCASGNGKQLWYQLRIHGGWDRTWALARRHLGTTQSAKKLLKRPAAKLPSLRNRIPEFRLFPKARDYKHSQAEVAVTEKERELGLIDLSQPPEMSDDLNVYQECLFRSPVFSSPEFVVTPASSTPPKSPKASPARKSPRVASPASSPARRPGSPKATPKSKIKSSVSSPPAGKCSSFLQDSPLSRIYYDNVGGLEISAWG